MIFIIAVLLDGVTQPRRPWGTGPLETMGHWSTGDLVTLMPAQNQYHDTARAEQRIIRTVTMVTMVTHAVMMED